MDAVLADLRHSLRLVRRAPGFATVAIATLALGIGANTAIYTLVDAVLLRPLPYAAPDRVVMVWEDATFIGFPRNTPAAANYFDWKARNRVFSDIAATRSAGANLTVDGPPEQVVGRRVTASFFSVLRVAPALGRAFTDQEDREGAPVAVISHSLWWRRFAGRADVIGAPITMNGETRTIIGVMPRDFVYRNSEFDFWIPMAFTPELAANRASHNLQVVGRLADGVSLERAREDMQGIAAQLAAEYPGTNAGVGAVVAPIREDLVGDTRLAVMVLMAAAGCVLLIACANLASLLLSRAVARRSELAVRVALGADAPRLVRQMVTEALVLAGAGGLLGVLLAPFATRVIAGLVPQGVPAVGAGLVDLRVLAFGAALSVLTGLLFSIVPAWQASRASLADALQQGGRSSVGGPRTTTRDLLVVAQVAATLVLLVGAGLMLKTLVNLRASDLGFNADHLLTLRTTLPAAKYGAAPTRLAFYDRVLGGVRRIPGVEAASYASTIPFQAAGNTQSYRIEHVPNTSGVPFDALFRVGTNEYLTTLGVRLVEGRVLDDRDADGAPLAVVINRTMARRHWPGESPIGHRVNFGGPDAPWRTIVGVVEDVRERGYDLDMKPGVYLPYDQLRTTWALPEVLVVRSSGQPGPLTQSIRQVIERVDPEQPIAAVRTMDEWIDRDIGDRQQQAILLGTFAGLALLLAAVGLYGVLSYGVTRRRREIGVRMALGATRVSVVRLVVGHGLTLTAIGLVAGGLTAWALTPALSTLLYGVGTMDPATMGGMVALLCAVATFAVAIPAVRAARVDPMTVLRDE